LSPGPIGGRWDLLSERTVLHVLHDAHDFRLAHPLAERRRPAKVSPGEGFVYDHDGGRVCRIALREIAAKQNRRSKREKVLGADRVEVSFEVLIRSRRIAFDLDVAVPTSAA